MYRCALDAETMVYFKVNGVSELIGERVAGWCHYNMMRHGIFNSEYYINIDSEMSQDDVRDYMYKKLKFCIQTDERDNTVDFYFL